MKKEEWSPSDYRKYKMEKEEMILCFIEGLFVMGSILWIFYQSILVVFLLCPITIFYIRYQCKRRCSKRKWELTLQFREGVQALVASLSAGYAVENAFVQAIKDLTLLYDDDVMIVKEFEYIVYQLRMNIPVEVAIQEFATRSDVEDIENLSEVFTTAKRTGGDLIKILRSTCKIIGDKIDVTREINTVMSGKRFEANIMSLIPIGIILYMKLSSPGFLDPLYGNAIGILIMTIALIIYLGSYILMNKIVSIDV